jgi:hypothetical protein
VGAIYEAFSLATASTFTVGIVTSLAAAGLVLLLREAPAPVPESFPLATSGATASPHQVVVPVEVDDDLRAGRH